YLVQFLSETQGFLVRRVERVVNLNWEDVHAATNAPISDYLACLITELEEKAGRNILDVEKILAEVAPIDDSGDPVF
ncbi:MAG: hypothetical protein U5L96_19165, partial [Owenweeksia sp.]|nr:hypothetical protein [Owenweeksia sp.]